MHFVKSTAAVAVFVATVVATKGKATYFEPNNGYGACGQRIQNSDHKVALSSAQYGNGEHCGKTFTVEHNGEGIVVEVADLCPGCDSNQIDLTSGAFKVLAPLDDGVVSVNYYL
ncbi:barwin-like endoglucanase [Favolaschia claudopus]|uniref:Barwin-like endoglucanase n=1 Tax=Favolaschia claudopus TaxID=2862362 RepID=A0AAW0DW62_9AGAR